MLLRLLALRGSSGPKKHAFRWRGDGVSRIEGLSDTVFGFAITLVAVSLEVPRTAAALLHNAAGFIPFVVSFLVLFFVRRTQFEFFRRYGLEDEPTIWLTGMLLVFVLFLIYPLKFLLTAFSDAVVAGDVAKDRFRLEQFPSVLGLYAIGFTGIAVSFALLYRNALRQGEELALTELERFDTSATYRRWTRVTFVGATIVLWCGALLMIPEHLHARDGVYQIVSQGGSAIVLAVSSSQAFLRRSLARQRGALMARLGGDAPPSPPPPPSALLVD